MRQHYREDERIDVVKADMSREAATPQVRARAHSLALLQRRIGNQAVLRYLGSGTGPRLSRVRGKGAMEDQTEYDGKLKRFREFEGKGREYYTKMVAASKNADAVDKDTRAKYDERYATTAASGSAVPSNVTGNVRDPSGYTLVETGVKGRGSAYKNYVSGAEGTLVASWNYANEDVGGEGSRLPHSEVLYRQYTEFGGPLKDLTTIIRSSIQGEAANELIDMCKGNKGQKFSGITFTPADEEFYALLASDNGKAVAFMLTDHPVESGRKTITSIKMYLDRLVLTLGQLT